MRLGDVILTYRKKNNITMNEFAEMSGISRSYIAVLEKGVRPQSGNPVCPSVDKIRKAAKGMGMTFDELFHLINEDITVNESNDMLECTAENAVLIPVLGRVAAGIPFDAIDDVLGSEAISLELAEAGEFYGLLIHGNSMEPRIFDGDIVIVRKAEFAVSGDIVVATTNTGDAICKKYITYGDTAILRSLNPSCEDIDVTGNPDFHILGIVIEVRGKII